MKPSLLPLSKTRFALPSAFTLPCTLGMPCAFAISALAVFAVGCGGASAEPPPVAPIAILEEEEPVEVEPGPSPDEIRKVVGGRDSDMRKCFLMGTFRNAQLAGTVNVTFTIETDGRVSDATDAGSDLPDPEVVTCVLGVFAALEFRPGGVSATEVTYPIRFGHHG